MKIGKSKANIKTEKEEGRRKEEQKVFCLVSQIHIQLENVAFLIDPLLGNP